MNACGGEAARVLREYAYFSPELKAILEDVYKRQREEYRRLQTVKGNIDQILRRSEPQRRKEQSHER